MERLKLVLENNHFFFDNNYFLQIKGTAMGTKVAPTYANTRDGIFGRKTVFRYIMYRKTVFLPKVTSNMFDKTSEITSEKIGSVI